MIWIVLIVTGPSICGGTILFSKALVGLVTMLKVDTKLFCAMIFKDSYVSRTLLINNYLPFDPAMLDSLQTICILLVSWKALLAHKALFMV